MKEKGEEKGEKRKWNDFLAAAGLAWWVETLIARELSLSRRKRKKRKERERGEDAVDIIKSTFLFTFLGCRQLIDPRLRAEKKRKREKGKRKDHRHRIDPHGPGSLKR